MPRSGGGRPGGRTYGGGGRRWSGGGRGRWSGRGYGRRWGGYGWGGWGGWGGYPYGYTAPYYGWSSPYYDAGIAVPDVGIMPQPGMDDTQYGYCSCNGVNACNASAGYQPFCMPTGGCYCRRVSDGSKGCGNLTDGQCL